MQIENKLVLLAVTGILVGACGGSEPKATTPDSQPSVNGAQASCGAGHTDKNHCSASATAGTDAGH